MNIASTKTFFESEGVVSLKANIDRIPEAKALLETELENPARAIPYYAIYSPGWDEPRHFGGNVLTHATVKQVVEEALQAAREKSGTEKNASQNGNGATNLVGAAR